MSERLKETVLKTVGGDEPSVGSNPTLPAKSRSKLKWYSEVIAHAVRVRLGSWEHVGSSPTFYLYRRVV